MTDDKKTFVSKDKKDLKPFNDQIGENASDELTAESYDNAGSTKGKAKPTSR